MNYQPGLHIIAEISSSRQHLLEKSAVVRQLLNSQIEKYSLSKLGEVYHDFEPGGFTAVICLSESHISLHTWPEYERVNLDIYLSNYQRYNDDTARQLFDELVAFLRLALSPVNN
ncbi:S-adenosylmethionine decarboxylase [Paraflavitalea speifideaquila]|uniref:S-adenosylmethionine decarboxylase family protein n=1 Tax=Paraflavitalea speifideaquila TaxID=3076558 RepID=UPI0028E740B8|nr:S-adenosylmethionine decarboxylase [Paraflavitalea speifideiaquila]